MVEARLQQFGTASLLQAHTVSEVGLALQAQQVGMMVIQADDLGLCQGCLQLHSRARFHWTYALLVDGDFAPSGRGVQPSPEAQANRMTALLEAGGDAYVWVELDPSEADAAVVPMPAFERLLDAQLKVGLGASSRHRELLQTNDLLSSIALVDPLTELNNRRALDWDLPRQIKRARSGDRPLSLLIFDLDHFKKINDTHGHLVGDVSLKLLSARLRHNLRSNDTLFRYGGEEFVVLLSDTSRDGASDIAQRLCRTISNQAFTIKQGLELSLTVSVGLAELQPSDDGKGLSLLERADGRLRQAKQTGRNRVVTG